MIHTEIVPGQRYAIRERVSAGETLQRVEVIERVRGAKWKIRFLDEPNPGLVDCVASKNIVCRWSERKEFLSDERRLQALDDASAAQLKGKYGDVREDAVNVVLESSGEQGIAVLRGQLRADPDQIHRLMQRAGIEGELDPVAFVDRSGEMHVSFAGAERLAVALAGTEPKMVLLAIESEEAELEAKGWYPGERFWHEYLAKRRACVRPRPAMGRIRAPAHRSTG